MTIALYVIAFSALTVSFGSVKVVSTLMCKLL